MTELICLLYHVNNSHTLCSFAVLIFSESAYTVQRVMGVFCFERLYRTARSRGRGVYNKKRCDRARDRKAVWDKQVNGAYCLTLM